MRNLLRMTGRVLLCFLVFDVIGVVLTVLADLVAALDIVWETSTGLGYAVWFVTGVFCALAIYMHPDGEDFHSPLAQRRGTQVVVITTVVAIALGWLSSLFWSGSSPEPVAPDHPEITITYLATVVLGVAWARFVLFRERPVARPDPGQGPADPETTRRDTLRVHAALAAAESKAQGKIDTEAGDADSFEPAGFWAMLGFLLGVPVVLFLDAAFFLLGPFDVFDPWTDPILTTAVAGGIAWGALAARWRTPRTLLYAMHAPLWIGALTYLMAMLPAGIVVALGAPEWVANIITYAGFGIGFLLGGAVALGGLAEIFERPAPGWIVRS